MKLYKYPIIFALLNTKSLKSLTLTTGLTLWVSLVCAQSTLRGTVKDEDGEPLPDARVEIPALQMGALTNIDGIFSFSKLQPGTIELRISYLGKDTLRQSITVPANKTISMSFVLKEKVSKELQTVEILDNAIGKIDVQKVNTGVTKISTEEINLLPTLGTPDLAQYLQVVPGVVFTGDQGGQLYIRGGTPIQNMVLLDGAIIYNPFHTLGLFSVFDTDYIRSTDVYTGGFPAEYGGRTSSVMDIRTRNGSFKQFEGKVHVNPITSGALIEGPLFKKKDKDQAGASYLLSVRNCYLDATSKALYSYVNDTVGLPFSFTDIYGKISIGSGVNQVNLFGFYQRDNVNYKFPSVYSWNSGGGGLNFMLLPSNTSMIISGNLGLSSFSNEQETDTEVLPRKSSISGFNGRINFAYIFNSVDEFSYGIQLLGFSSNYQFTNSMGLFTKQEDNNTEAAGYVKYKKVFRKKSILPNGGYDYFNRFILEPSLRAHYYNDQAYVSIEPRLRMKLNFKGVSFQASFGRYSQNLVSANSDRDIVALFQGYIAAPPNVAATVHTHALQTAWHYVAGVQLELLPNLETNVEVWYKDFDQLTNINRERLFPSEPIFITETGKAYGIDLMLKYKFKRLYLYATYGLAKVERTDRLRGFTYPTIFDRRHTANFVGDYQMGDLRDKRTGKYLEAKWEVSARWTLGSGFPFTQTQAFFEKLDYNRQGSGTDVVTQNGTLGILLSSDFNGGRLPYYHRLDLSFKRRFLIGNTNVLELNLNALNIYNRANIFYFDRIRYERVDQLPFIPTLGLSFKF